MTLKGLADRLRAARAAADLTQGAVASALGYVPETIANWERNRAEPSASDLARLAVLYRVSVDWLLTGEPRMPHRFERAERCAHDVPITDRCVACEVPK
jgi:transcriptional regulator with XRE-family HTH domain